MDEVVGESLATPDCRGVDTVFGLPRDGINGLTDGFGTGRYPLDALARGVNERTGG